MEAGCCIQDSSLAVQGEMDLVQVTFTTNYQAVFHVDVRPVLGQQLYHTDLVQLIITAGKWELNGPEGIFCVNLGTPLTAVCVICPGRA